MTDFFHGAVLLLGKPSRHDTGTEMRVTGIGGHSLNTVHYSQIKFGSMQGCGANSVHTNTIHVPACIYMYLLCSSPVQISMSAKQCLTFTLCITKPVKGQTQQ